MQWEPKRRAIPAALSATVIGLGLAACGGNDGGSPATLPPLPTPPPSTTVVVTTTTGPAQYYEVQPGDSLFGIAERFGVRLEDLIALNGITDPDRIEAGEKLQIPPPTVLVTGDESSTTSSDQVP